MSPLPHEEPTDQYQLEPTARFGRAAWLTLAFALAIVGLSAAQIVYRYFLPTDGWEVTENSIDSPEWLYFVNLVGAPSELQQNDVVTGIEGQSLSSLAAGETPEFWTVGNTLSYDVLRNGTQLVVAVPVVRWTVQAIVRNQTRVLSTALSTAGTILLLAVGFLAFFKRSNDPAARALLLYVSALAANGISTLIPGGLSAVFDPIAYISNVYFSYLIFGTLLAPALLAFTLVFPHPKPIIRKHPWLAYSPFLAGALTLLLLLTTGVAEIGWLATLVMMALSILSLVHSAFTMRDAVSRAQLLWAFGGLVLGIGFFMLNFPSAFGWVNDTWAYRFAMVAGLGIPIAGLGLAMAVLRYRLFDIDVIIRRTTSYALLTSLLLLVYFGSVVVLQRLFTSITGQSSTVAVVLSTLLIAALFLPLRRRVQDTIDRRFFRRKYDAEKVLNQFAATVRDETDLDALTAELVRVIQETMQPEFVSVWLAPEAGQSQSTSLSIEKEGTS